MNSSVVRIESPLALSVSVTEDTLSVDLNDGRTIAVPLQWYPRLAHATESERARWRLTGNGQGIHWHDLDEDISIKALLAGQPSSESQSSLQRWLSRR